jgi:monovalent cation:proton antiporter-2 (CPA2) family protein
MGGQEFFYQAFVYLAAAVISVPIAKRLGLGSVLGYLFAGIAIGPFGLGLIGEEGQDVMHFAEFGVVMMLFLIGLELQPALLWRLRSPILGLGGLQVGVTAIVIGAIALMTGQAWRTALAIGMILALSSTAMVLQTLAEKGLMRTRAGESSFAVLLFQDIAVIPILALLPLLAVAPVGGRSAAAHGDGWIDTLPGWMQTAVVLGAVAAIVLASRFLVNPAFRIMARTRLRELFIAAALLLILAIALLMQAVGLSPALGTFLAGVILAGSEFRHELESEIEPFKGLLLGLFFIAVGASIDFRLIGARPGLIAALVIGLLVVKFVVLFGLGRAFRMGLDQGTLFAFALAQGGEFGFVLFSFAAGHGVIPAAVANSLVAVVGLSMGLTPLLMLVNEKFVQPFTGTLEREERPADTIHEDNPVIIAGFGRFGHVVGRLLVAQGVRVTVLDVDSDQVDLLRRLGLEVYYGDACRRELLEAAGAVRAKLLIVAIEDQDRTLRIVEAVKRNFPHLQILARARGRDHAYELLDAGVTHVHRETLDSSLSLAVDALRLLGFRAYQARRAARIFRRHDEESVRELAAMRHDRRQYLSIARKRIRDLEEMLRADLGERTHADDAAWDAESLREESRGCPEPES